MLGSFVLSAGYYDAYYKKALQVRTLIQREFDRALEGRDLILAPVAPTTAYRIGEKTSDPLQMYLGDVCTVPVNIAGFRLFPCPAERTGTACRWGCSSSEKPTARLCSTGLDMPLSRRERRTVKMSGKDYEMVAGLETHVELKTATKIFCGCSTAFGAEPNTQCCPVCTGMPGSLPVLNRQVVHYAIKAGLAVNCRIASYSKEDRKNYFYPDLPKAYQISQYDLPLCENGYLDIETGEGRKRIGITRIHIEEDAGKLIHQEGKGTLIDYNRCGVPLIEIVSEPDFRSVEEIKAYLRKLRATILYTGVSDCKMNEGSLRVDVNLSVRKKGEETLGTRTEMKNLNSFQFIAKAVEYEFRRQVEALEAGEEIIQETRRFDQASGKTFSMRRKEDANDYRYFPDPDLPPIEVSPDLLRELQAQIPVLPDQRKKEYVKRFGLTDYAAEQITLSREAADYFEQAARRTRYPKLAANLVLSESCG